MEQRDTLIYFWQHSTPRPGRVWEAKIKIGRVESIVHGLMVRHIDLVVVFKAASPSPSPHFSKQKARQDAQDAEDQYTRLLTTLRKAGLYAVGRRGEHQGQLILLVSCSGHRLRQLLQRERRDTSFAHIPFLPLNLSSLQPFRRPARPLNLCL